MDYCMTFSLTRFSSGSVSVSVSDAQHLPRLDVRVEGEGFARDFVVWLPRGVASDSLEAMRLVLDAVLAVLKDEETPLERDEDLAGLVRPEDVL